jgi:(p)ppGpp synthase/HD superfamily hydrolase
MSSYPTVKNNFFETIKTHPILKKDQKIIFEAFEYGEEKHKHEFRSHSEEPYFIHCTAVASNLLTDPDIKKDFIIAALLHDVIENTETKFDEIEKKFGATATYLVKALTKPPSSFKKEWGKEKYYKEGFFGPLIEASKTNPFALKIKLSDRLNNLETYWKFASKKKIVEYVWETRELLKISSNIATPLKTRIQEQLATNYSDY